MEDGSPPNNMAFVFGGFGLDLGLAAAASAYLH
jgi:hypothetical protein